MNSTLPSEGTYLSMGLSIIVYGIILLVIYVPMLLFFSLHPEFRAKPAFQIMLHMGIMDVGQLVIHVFSGFLVIGENGSLVGFWVNKTMGALIWAMYMVMQWFLCVLNFNRFSAIILSKFSSLHSQRITTVLSLIGYAFFLVLFVLHLMPNINYIFVTEGVVYKKLAEDITLSWKLFEYEPILIGGVVISSMLAYGSILINIVKAKKKMEKREAMITLQACVIVCCFSFVYIYWSTVQPPLNTDVSWAFTTILLWMSLNGINPIIYLLCNRHLRVSMIRFFFTRSSPKTSTVVRSRRNASTVSMVKVV